MYCLLLFTFIPGSNSSIPGVSNECSFQPATLSLKIGLTIAYVIIFFIGFFGNAMIIFLVNHYPELKTTFNILIVNMAASDILDVITAIPLSLTYLYESVRWFPGGFGVFLCKSLPFLAYTSIGSSILTLTVMTYDRYHAVVRTMRRPLAFRLIVTAIVSTWVIPAVVFASELYKYKLYHESGQVICAPRWVDDLLASHEITKYEMIIRFVLFYLIPLLVMTVLYSKIVLRMWKRRAPGEHIDKNRQRIEMQNRKVIIMLITVVTIFALCWLPVQATHFLLTFNPNICLSTSLTLTLFVVSHAYPAINPCLYLIFNENFRGAFRHQLRKSQRSKRLSVTVSNGTHKSGSHAVGATECHRLLALDRYKTRESVV